jgi:hypothetical protein
VRERSSTTLPDISETCRIEGTLLFRDEARVLLVIPTSQASKAKTFGLACATSEMTHLC